MARCTARSDVSNEPRNTTSVEANTQTRREAPARPRDLRSAGAAFVSSDVFALRRLPQTEVSKQS